VDRLTQEKESPEGGFLRPHKTPLGGGGGWTGYFKKQTREHKKTGFKASRLTPGGGGAGYRGAGRGAMGFFGWGGPFLRWEGVGKRWGGPRDRRKRIYHFL